MREPERKEACERFGTASVAFACCCSVVVPFGVNSARILWADCGGFPRCYTVAEGHPF